MQIRLYDIDCVKRLIIYMYVYKFCSRKKSLTLVCNGLR